MSGLEFNKIIASIFVAIIVFIIIGLVGNLIVKKDQFVEQETAYLIEVPEKTAESVQSLNTDMQIESISSLLVNASLKNGEKISKKCSTCHNYSKDSKSKVGPNLWNLINKPKASVSGYAYSKALSDAGGVWGYEELNKFLYKPKDYISGTKMNFAGLKKTQDRADLILWLRDKSDNPAPLP
ncbi:MAG: Cytochrome c-552 [Alphaproteobacteria bacterium MarineAlpha5_Bin8]|nr:MAG: Cytochrome c-552 [Alphaproteobacteria bacterium MarineAlpha5_Bin8]PPR54352.1 MAG: Cytochrome c-552 [Alphaproteobacteria bacterium MarineAlpha5_Bin6]|tara:strand:- start:1760 stop:2305 length:546 start_codon:yes stop_codon:yes gene_type:complete